MSRPPATGRSADAARAAPAPNGDAPSSEGPSEPRLILGTAGHIDHGKTALVQALTGVDTDRLKEEKARGITIELGFAELRCPGGPVFGVVDVPGHEAFVRTMVAGATGMDVVLLVVAADEGVMPQTREHLAVVELLGVSRLVVALTKTDLVEPEWMELVRQEVSETLAGTPYRSAPVVATSARTGAGLDELVAALAQAGSGVRRRREDDLVRLPVDRVFTVQGTGTVATGTLWSGRLAVGDAVRVLPGSGEARVRGLQRHDQAADEVPAGSRTAVALTGAGADRDAVRRGSVLVAHPAWEETHMLTVRARLLADTSWSLEHNQRIRVHLGTDEIMARCALLEEGPLTPGSTGWVQLRLEAPTVARALDRLVLRSYSPVTTLGGAVVAEPAPEKRRRLTQDERATLDALLDGTPQEALAAVLEAAGWRGVDPRALPVLTGLSPGGVEGAWQALQTEGAVECAGRRFSAQATAAADRRLMETVGAYHRDHPMRTGVPLATLRAALPPWTPAGLADARLKALAEAGDVVVAEGAASFPGREVRLTPKQAAVREALLEAYGAAGLAPPARDELPDDLREHPDVDELLLLLQREGHLVPLDDGVLISAERLAEAEARVVDELGGAEGLGPAEFREVLPVTRKHLMPLLAHLDRVGVTLRSPEGRSVRARPV